ncbi:RGS domain-containing protein [Blakeslea trispora]|nr:RGS domain-containing protein [Blakeslea trispora]
MPSPSIPTTGSNYDLSYYFQQPDAQNEEFPKVFYKRARSLSIGSVISTSQQQYIPQSDHTKSLKYKIKTNKSNQKAHQFFGEQIKLEITAKEIRREGLRALLLSTVPLGYFLYYLLNEYSSENLFFYLAVENYQNYEFSSHSERVHVATKISRAYLTRNSELEVNLEDKIYRTVQESLELLQQQEEENSYSTGTEFDAAKKHIFSLLNASYYRFRTTNVFNIMESKCSK